MWSTDGADIAITHLRIPGNPPGIGPEAQSNRYRGPSVGSAGPRHGRRKIRRWIGGKLE